MLLMGLIALPGIPLGSGDGDASRVSFEEAWLQKCPGLLAESLLHAVEQLHFIHEALYSVNRLPVLEEHQRWERLLQVSFPQMVWNIFPSCRLYS